MRVVHHPLGGAASFRNTRSVLVKGFPISIVYRLSKTEVLIVALAAHRKRPQYWLGRIN